MRIPLTLTDQLLASTVDNVMSVDGYTTGQLMLFPSARLVEQYIRAIPAGESRDIATMRRDLAARRSAHVTSLPVLRERLLAVAETVFTDLDDGALLREVTPVWRVHVEHSDALLRRLSYEPAFLLDLRASERPEPAVTARQAA